MYKKIIKPVLFLFPPESVHHVFVFCGETLGRFSVGRWLVAILYNYSGKDMSKTVDGLFYKTPFILSAGFDYNARLTQILPSLSFGGVEVGSVTAKPCAGNPRPRLTRLPHSQSILVNKGLRNDGVEAIIKRLQKKEKIPDFVLGVSIARTNSSCSAGVAEGIADYVESLEKLVTANIGDYYTINISCPNSFGGEAFIKPELLEQLFTALDKIVCAKPIYVKMPINVSKEVFMNLLAVLDKHRVAGVITGNLQKDYNRIDSRDCKPETYKGGLSGLPCQESSTEFISLTKQKYQNRFTIIGCGGVFSVKDVEEKMAAGADLIQLITGMIYEGPGLIKRLCHGLSLQKSQK